MTFSDTQKLQRSILKRACIQTENPETRAYGTLAASIILMIQHQGYADTIEHLRNVADRIENDVFMKEKESI